MNTDTLPPKPKTHHKVINVLLIIMNLWSGIGICSMYSSEIFSLHQEIILIVPAVLLIFFMIVKEIRVRPLIKRLYYNLSILGGFVLITIGWAFMWY